ncbi:Pectinesterase domain-containing protein/PMEI domain-containing protein, partial [Cephalotus follicularis]
LPNQPDNVYNYGRFSVRKSLSNAGEFLNSIDNYLNQPNLAPPLIGGLEDCYFLASLNMDFLSSSLQTVNATGAALRSSNVDNAHTLLSAILTNQWTCLDSIKTTDSAGSITSSLSVPLTYDTKLYSLSLALFTKGWVPEKQKGFTWTPTQHQPRFSNGRLQFQMTDRTRAIYDSVRKKSNFLQADDNEVLISDMVVVSKDGSGRYTKINDAIAAAPDNTDGSNGYFMIYIRAGVYQEYVSVPKNKIYLMIHGDGIDKTVITGNRNADDGSTTFNSATFAVVASYFLAVNITFRNTAGAIKNQAVAVRNGADMSAFYSCSFEGYQDTLYTQSLRQFYRECDIYGTVDYIFGNAAVVFQNCNLYPRKPLKGQYNTITAQGRTDPNQNTGTSIQNCNITAAPDLNASTYTVDTYLGRPYKEYSVTVYMLSYMRSLINPAGWHEWDGNFALRTLYYAEYNNNGPGSVTNERVTWPGYHRAINATAAAKFTVSNFISGNNWLPQTGVPYTPGLQ